MLNGSNLLERFYTATATVSRPRQ